MAGVPPKRGEIFYWETELTSQANTNIFQVNPTIVAGDVIVYQDGVLDGNIDTTPTPIGASATVACQLSVAETTGVDRVKVRFHDVVGAQWQDQSWEFFFVDTPLDEFIAAIWSYATRTLTSFGTLVADIVTAILASALVANIWTYATRTLTSFGTLVADIVSALLAVPAVRMARRQIELELYRGDTWEQNIWRLGDISTRTMLWVTARFQRDDADSTSAFQIEETAGLIYIDGAAGTPANGSITVVDAAAGSIVVRLEAVETAKLDALHKLYYDVQWTDGTDVLTPRRGRLLIISDVTRAVS